MTETKLTDNQQKFVDLLFDAMHDGIQLNPANLQDLVQKAGYGPSVGIRHLLTSKAIRDTIYEQYKNHVAMYGLEAFSNLLDVMRNPDKKAWRAQLSSAQAILDASTIPYKNQDQVANEPTGIVILPARKKVVIQVETDQEQTQEDS